MDNPTPSEDLARLRAAIERAETPAALRLRVEREIVRARRERARRRRLSAGGLVLAGAVAGTAAALVLPAGSAPSVAQVAQAAMTAPRAPAPAVDRSEPWRLQAHVGDVWFPTWSQLDWRASGRSSATIGGRRALTVYYTRGDSPRVAYTIVNGTLRWPADARVVTRGWMRLHVYTDARQRVVTWREQRHQCLLVAPRSVTETTLLALASGDA